MSGCRSLRVLVVLVALAASGGVALSAAAHPAAAAPPRGQIAFVRSGDIWIVNTDGSGQRQLTSTADSDRRPCWSPDGRQIAFLRGGKQVWVMDADGTHGRRVRFPLGLAYMPGTRHKQTNYTVQSIAWSPSGNDLAIGVNAYSEYPDTAGGINVAQLYLMHPDGSDRRRVGGLIYGWPIRLSWRPNGRQILTTLYYRMGYSSAKTFDLGTRRYSDAFGKHETVSKATWSPNGQWIAAERSDDQTYILGPGTLVTLDPATRARQDLWRVDRGYGWTYIAPAWSPDSQWLACSVGDYWSDDYETPPRHDLEMVSVNGSSYWLLADADDPAWRPPARRQDVVAALGRLRAAVLAQYARDLDLTASTYIATSEYRREARITESVSMVVQKLKEALSVVDGAVTAAGFGRQQLVDGSVLSSQSSTQRLLTELGEAEGSGPYRTVATSTGIAALIGNFKNVDEYDFMPSGYGKLSRAADAIRKQHGTGDRAVAEMVADIENSQASPDVPLREASWTSGVRPKASGWALCPVQVRSAVKRLFAAAIDGVPAALPAGYDATAVVTRLDQLRYQVVATGDRRVDFSGIPGLQGPTGTQRKIPLGLIDGNWRALSRLETAQLKHLKVRRSQSVQGTVDGGLSVISLLSGGGSSAVVKIAQPVLLGYQLGQTLTTVPEQSVSPVGQMSENEFDMSMHLVEDLANLYEISACTKAYMERSLAGASAR